MRSCEIELPRLRLEDLRAVQRVRTGFVKAEGCNTCSFEAGRVLGDFGCLRQLPHESCHDSSLCRT